MTAAELNALSSAAADEANRIAGITEQAILRGLVAAAEAFDHNAPLPSLRILPREQVWEPAARRYRDLTDEERGDDARL